MKLIAIIIATISDTISFALFASVVAGIIYLVFPYNFHIVVGSIGLVTLFLGLQILSFEMRKYNKNEAD